MILKSNDLSWQRREGYALSTNFKRQCGDHRYRSYGGCPMPRGRPRLPATGNPAKRVSARCHGTLALIKRKADGRQAVQSANRAPTAAPSDPAVRTYRAPLCWTNRSWWFPRRPFFPNVLVTAASLEFSWPQSSA
jgi:hypothetical protein